MLSGRPPRMVLASASPARLGILQRAGLHPEVIISGIDEESVRGADVAARVAELARRKAEAVLAVADRRSGDVVVIGCDSLLELDGIGLGKPSSGQDAAARWRRMRGRCGVLHTGHHLILATEAGSRRRTATASTTVYFAWLDDDEIEAYVATGEPVLVAGAFTIDGLGGPFVERVEGDPHNVVGISLPLVRSLLADLGVRWTSLWSGSETPRAGSGTGQRLADRQPDEHRVQGDH